MVPTLSIIIPCYNSESTLEETLESVLEQDYQDWEAIMVNDGSPDNLEDIALKWIEKDARFKYFKKENGGLGSARNYGIKEAKGNFILPLDSDNKIGKTFAKKAIIIIQENVNVGVVYGDAMYFGEKNELWKVGAFDKYKMLEHNYIDACAIIRKKIFDIIGLYDENLPYQGHEDWDLWLRVLATNYTFSYLEEVTFNYRVDKDSMIKRFNMNMLNENISYIKFKNNMLYIEAVSEINKDFKNLHKIEKSTFWMKLKRKFNI